MGAVKLGAGKAPLLFAIVLHYARPQDKRADTSFVSRPAATPRDAPEGLGSPFCQFCDAIAHTDSRRLLHIKKRLEGTRRNSFF